MKCPKCDEELEQRPDCFYFRGRSFSGLVCKKCNSLRNNPDDSFLAYVAKEAKKNPQQDQYES